MSYQYPQAQYPQYPNYPQPPAGAGGSGIAPQPDAPTPPTYTPLPSDLTVAELHSAQLTAVAAGKQPAELAVKGPEGPPADFPFLMYKQDGITTTTKAAKDAKDKADLQSKGYSENPPQPNPAAITEQMLQDLQIVWQKAGDTLTQLMQLVQQQQAQMQAASNVLGAGQQQGTGQAQQSPNLFQQQQYPTSGYPQPTGD